MDKITLKRESWDKFVKTNSGDSYSMLICYAILILWESGAINRDEAYKILTDMHLGMSGTQADIAIEWALSYAVEGLPSPEMAKIRQESAKGNE